MPGTACGYELGMSTKGNINRSLIYLELTEHREKRLDHLQLPALLLPVLQTVAHIYKMLFIEFIPII